MNKEIITIGRQFGSGGRALARALAKELGFAYYDKELLAVAAEESGLSAAFLREYDEKPTSSLLYSLVMNQLNGFADAAYTLDGLAMDAQRKALLHAAQGKCVIVGRCADYVLRDEPGLLRVFISADHKDRVERIMARDHVDAEAAERSIRRMDKSRKAYYDSYTSGGWGEAANYDLAINISKTGLEGAIRVICQLRQEAG